MLDPPDSAGARPGPNAAKPPSLAPGLSADWRSAAPADLIGHILERYHARHREQLPELVLLARRIEQVHAGRGDCPLGLAAHLADMQQELESHMMKEEQVLFLLLARGRHPEGPIGVMRYEHRQHEQALERIDALTDRLRAPADACNTWHRLYLALAEFRDDLIEHLDLENDFLFQTPDTGTRHA